MLDAGGDLAVVDFDLALVEGAAQVGQRLKTRLKSFLGEWFLDTDFGVPYFQEILKKGPDLNRVIAVIQEQILADAEVLEITDFQTTYDNGARAFSYRFRVNTVFGVVEGGS